MGYLVRGDVAGLTVTCPECLTQIWLSDSQYLEDLLRVALEHEHEVHG